MTRVQKLKKGCSVVGEIVRNCRHAEGGEQGTGLGASLASTNLKNGKYLASGREQLIVSGAMNLNAS